METWRVGSGEAPSLVCKLTKHTQCFKCLQLTTCLFPEMASLINFILFSISIVGNYEETLVIRRLKVTLSFCTQHKHVSSTVPPSRRHSLPSIALFLELLILWP